MEELVRHGARRGLRDAAAFVAHDDDALFRKRRAVDILPFRNVP